MFGWSDVGMGCPGRWWNQHRWSAQGLDLDLGDAGLWLDGGLGDPEGLFQT